MAAGNAAGERIEYTLDAAGNITHERYKDDTGATRRLVERGLVNPVTGPLRVVATLSNPEVAILIDPESGNPIESATFTIPVNASNALMPVLRPIAPGETVLRAKSDGLLSAALHLSVRPKRGEISCEIQLVPGMYSRCRLDVTGTAPDNVVRIESSDPARVLLSDGYSGAVMPVIEGRVNQGSLYFQAHGVAFGRSLLTATLEGVEISPMVAYVTHGTIWLQLHHNPVADLTSKPFRVGLSGQSRDPRNVVVEVSDPTVALLVTAQHPEGTAAATFAVDGSRELSIRYLSAGAVTLTVQADGFDTTARTITVDKP